MLVHGSVSNSMWQVAHSTKHNAIPHYASSTWHAHGSGQQVQAAGLGRWGLEGRSLYWHAQ